MGSWSIGSLKKAPAPPPVAKPLTPQPVAKPLTPQPAPVPIAAPTLPAAPVVEPAPPPAVVAAPEPVRGDGFTPMSKCACGRSLLVSTVEIARGHCDLCILDKRLAEQGHGPTTIVHADGSTLTVGAPKKPATTPAAPKPPPLWAEPPTPRVVAPPPPPVVVVEAGPVVVVDAPKRVRSARAIPKTRADFIDRFLCGDSIAGLQEVPDKCIDHTITDPPYEEHTHTKAVRHKGKAGGEYVGTLTDDLGFAHITEAQRDECAKQIVRTTRGWAIVFCEDDALYLWRRALVKYGAKWRRNGVWHKTNAMPKLHGDGPAQATEHFVIVWCGDGPSVWNRGGRGNVWSYPKEHSKIHKTRKPLALIQDLVLSFTRPGEFVADPFAGSGTTLIACKNLGRSYLGWEFREETHRLAKVDVDNAREQLSFFAGTFRGDSTMRAGAFITDEDANKRENKQASFFDALEAPKGGTEDAQRDAP